MDVNKVVNHVYNSVKRAKYDKTQGLQKWHDTILKNSKIEHCDIFEKVANVAEHEKENEIKNMILDYVRRIKNGN